jgi:predicted Holliday junction resolvase-like endonuclease
MTLKGRHWVMLWLALFLGVAAAVQLRQTAAIRTASRMARLRQERITLESRQADLERRIREASSRQVLGKKAQEDLHLHFPRDSEQAPLAIPGQTVAP